MIRRIYPSNTLTATDLSSIMVSMNRLAPEKRELVLAALVEGNSIRATCRVVGVSKNTVIKLLVDIGRVCADYQDRVIRALKPERIQSDEIWSFCYSKEKNVPADKRGQFGYGDVWTWVAIDPDTKLVLTWLVGLRTAADAECFMLDLASRVMNPAQLTTDGLSVYPDAVYEAFGSEIDYAQLIKVYGAENPGAGRYSPPKCNGAKKKHVIGCPDPQHICTSHVERQNLTMRMSMRRFTRLTNAFGKKAENTEHAVALHFMHYNFCRKHQTIGKTPAQAAGLTDRAWTLADIVALLEAKETSK